MVLEKCQISNRYSRGSEKYREKDISAHKLFFFKFPYCEILTKFRENLGVLILLINLKFQIDRASGPENIENNKEKSEVPITPKPLDRLRPLTNSAEKIVLSTDPEHTETIAFSVRQLSRLSSDCPN